MLASQIKYIILHHTGPDTDGKTFAKIKQEHLDLGWQDVGYNFVVDGYGTIHEGRSLKMPGAHALGYNFNSVGIACIGNFEAGPLPEIMRNSVVKIARLVMGTYCISLKNVLRHKDVSKTACPGRFFPYEQILKELEVEEVPEKELISGVPKNHWARKDYELMFERNFIAGSPLGHFSPDQPITEARMVAMLRRVLAEIAPEKLDFDFMVPTLTEIWMPSVARIFAVDAKTNKQYVGSAGFVTPSILLTNAHVVLDNEVVSVDTDDFHPNNGKRKGTVIKRDVIDDLALVKINWDGKYKPFKLASKIVRGEPCLVLGMPGGEWQSVSTGVVSSDDRDIYIETDARINPGNSGGVVLNHRGELLAMPSHKIVPSPAFDNQNYAIDVDRIREFLKGVV